MRSIRFFDEYLQWVEDTMTTERQLYIKVACAMIKSEVSLA